MAKKKELVHHTIIFMIDDGVKFIELKAKEIAFNYNGDNNKIYFYNEDNKVMLAVDYDSVILHFDSKRNTIENF